MPSEPMRHNALVVTLFMLITYSGHVDYVTRVCLYIVQINDINSNSLTVATYTLYRKTTLTTLNDWDSQASYPS